MTSTAAAEQTPPTSLSRVVPTVPRGRIRNCPSVLQSELAAAHVLLLVDVDSASHSLSARRGVRAEDKAIASLADDLRNSLAQEGATVVRERWAASSVTARTHFDLLATSPANTWVVRRGRDGADGALLEELAHLELLQTRGTRPGSLVVLVGGDGAYAPAVRRLRLLGIPTWVVAAPAALSRELARTAWAVSSIHAQDVA